MATYLYDLVKSAQLNDEASLVELIMKFKPLISKLSKKLIYEEAETDLIIEFINIILNINLNNFNHHNDGALVSYFHLTLKRKGIDLFRKSIKKLDEDLEINLDIIQVEDDSKQVISRLFAEELLENACLSSKQRLILTEKYINDLSDNEIGTKLNISRQAVNGLKRKAIENLRSFLGLKN